MYSFPFPLSLTHTEDKINKYINKIINEVKKPKVIIVPQVMQRVMAALDMDVLPYIRTDRVRITHRWVTAEGGDLQPPPGTDALATTPTHVQMRVENQHGADCPVPMVHAVDWHIGEVGFRQALYMCRCSVDAM